MKKFLAILICVIMALSLFAFAACKGNKGEADQSSNTASSGEIKDNGDSSAPQLSASSEDTSALSSEGASAASSIEPRQSAEGSAVGGGDNSDMPQPPASGQAPDSGSKGEPPASGDMPDSGFDPGTNPGGNPGTNPGGNPGTNPGGGNNPGGGDDPGSKGGGAMGQDLVEEIDYTEETYDVTAIYAQQSKFTAMALAETDEEKVTSHEGVTVTSVDLFTLTGDYKIEASGNYVFSGKSAYSIVIAKKGIDIHIWLENAEFTSVFSDKKPSSTVITLVGDNKMTGGACASDTKNEAKGTLNVKNNLTINGSGTLTIAGSLDDTNGIHCTGTLKIVGATLNVTGSKHAVRGNDAVVIIGAKISATSLVGDGIQTDNEQEYAAGSLEAPNGDTGYIYIENSEITVNAKDDGISAATFLYMKGSVIDVTTNGGAVPVTEIKSNTGDTVDGKAFRAGTIEFTEQDGTTVTEVTDKTFYAIIIEGGTFTVNSNDDAFHSEGNMIVAGGTFTVNTSDDAFHAAELMRIDDGEITVPGCYEGIEGAKVEIYGGNISIIASDDGINSADGSALTVDVGNPNCYCKIAGGEIYIVCAHNGGIDGDGIDCNGTLLFTGGVVHVNGWNSVNSVDSALDSDGGMIFNGGTIIAVGPLGRNEGIASNSTQNVLRFAADSTINPGTLTLKKGDEVVLTYVTEKQSKLVIISCPELVKGESYALYLGDELLTEFTVEDTVTVIGDASGDPSSKGDDTTNPDNPGGDNSGGNPGGDFPGGDPGSKGNNPGGQGGDPGTKGENPPQ